MKLFAAVFQKIGLALLTCASAGFAQQYCVEGVFTQSQSALFKVGDPVQITATVTAPSRVLCVTKENFNNTCSAVEILTVTFKTPSRVWTDTKGTLQINEVGGGDDVTGYFLLDAVLDRAAKGIQFSFSPLIMHRLIVDGTLPKTLPKFEARFTKNSVFSEDNNKDEFAFVGDIHDKFSSPIARFSYTGNCGQPAPPVCPNFQKMISEADELRKLASTLEKDDGAYENAIADILVKGYESDYARVAISRVTDDQIYDQFPDVSTIYSVRGKIVAKFREAADIRSTIATLGANRAGSHETAAVDARWAPLATKNVLDYFCTPDPNKMTVDVWRALWASGYVDFETYDRIGYQAFSRRFDRGLLIASIGSFLTEFGAASLFTRTVAIERVEVATVRARVALAIAEGRLPASELAFDLGDKWVEVIRALTRNKIPKELGEGKLTRSAIRGKGVGIRWIDAGAKGEYNIRFDKGNPSSKLPWQRFDHVAIRYRGKIVGRGGIEQASADTEDAHIPLDEWVKWSKWYQP